MPSDAPCSLSPSMSCASPMPLKCCTVARLNFSGGCGSRTDVDGLTPSVFHHVLLCLGNLGNQAADRDRGLGTPPAGAESGMCTGSWKTCRLFNRKALIRLTRCHPSALWVALALPLMAHCFRPICKHSSSELTGTTCPRTGAVALNFEVVAFDLSRKRCTLQSNFVGNLQKSRP